VNPQVVSSPFFTLLIAFSVMLSLGYLWGRRRNQRIFFAAFNDLVSVLEPKDQQFTNIGGFTGYHANFVPHRNRYVRRVDATITLLARQSWLWYPFSRLLRRFDRLFLVFHLSPAAIGVLEEGHLIEDSYSRFHGSKIENASELRHRSLSWGGLTWHLYSASDAVEREMESCRAALGEPQGVRHIAMVPEQERLWMFLVPRPGTVGRSVGAVHRWFIDLVSRRVESAGRRPG
jgi:hypothetical protein